MRKLFIATALLAAVALAACKPEAPSEDCEWEYSSFETAPEDMVWLARAGSRGGFRSTTRPSTRSTRRAPVFGGSRGHWDCD